MILPRKVDIKSLKNIEGFSSEIQLALIDLICRYKNPNNVLEIGTWHGRTSVILAAYVNKKNGNYYGIEPHKKRADITLENCKNVCSPDILHIDKNVSFYSEMLKKMLYLDIVHIDGEHSFSAVYNDLSIVSKIMQRDGIIILDDFFFDMYPQITQATYKWLNDNPDYVLLAAGVLKGFICNKMYYKKYTDFLLSPEFINELKLYNPSEYPYISVSRTSPLIDCPTLGISLNISDKNFVGNECEDGRIEKIICS